MSGYDISASYSQSSAANPTGQFGDVIVTGGGGKQWIMWAIIGATVLLAIFLWRQK